MSDPTYVCSDAWSEPRVFHRIDDMPDDLLMVDSADLGVSACGIAFRFTLQTGMLFEREMVEAEGTVCASCDAIP